MERREEIEQAAQRYIHTEHDPDWSWNIRTGAFKAGVEWADQHPASPWHSVADEGFPKESGYYLCADIDYAIGGFDKGDHHFYDPLSRYDDERLDWVKYWMELPHTTNKIGNESK